MDQGAEQILAKHGCLYMKDDYKDFSHHFKGHAKSLIVIIPIFLGLAAIISYNDL